MNILDDLLPEGERAAKGTKESAVDSHRSKPEVKSYNLAVVIFWDRFVCQCGAESEGPRPGYHPAYFKHWNGSRQATEYHPITQADGRPDPTLPHEVSLQHHDIQVCPWCIPAIDTYPNESPEAELLQDAGPKSKTELDVDMQETLEEMFQELREGGKEDD